MPWFAHLPHSHLFENRDSLGNPVLRECAHDLRCYVHKPLIPATILLYPVALPLHPPRPSHPRQRADNPSCCFRA